MMSLLISLEIILVEIQESGLLAVHQNQKLTSFSQQSPSITSSAAQFYNVTLPVSLGDTRQILKFLPTYIDLPGTNSTNLTSLQFLPLL